MENKENEIDIVELLRILWTNKSKLIKWGVIGFVIGVIIAFSIPKQYDTVVKIAPESTSTSSNMGNMSALAGMVGINLGSGSSRDGVTHLIYPDLIKSTPFLLEFADIQVVNNKNEMTFYQYITEEQKAAWWGHIISAPFKFIGWGIGLFKEEREKRTGIDIFRPTVEQKRYISTLRNNISVVADKKTRVITIGVRMQNPYISAIIADSLMSKLQAYMTDYKTNKARKDLLVKGKMLDEAKQSYYLADDALAEGMDINRNITTKRGQVKINRLSDEKELAFTVYKQVATEVEVAKMKLQDETPIAAIIEPASVATRASSPSKGLIAIAFAFLGGTIMAGILLFKQKNI